MQDKRGGKTLGSGGASTGSARAGMDTGERRLVHPARKEPRCLHWTVGVPHVSRLAARVLAAALAACRVLSLHPSESPRRRPAPCKHSQRTRLPRPVSRRPPGAHTRGRRHVGQARGVGEPRPLAQAAEAGEVSVIVAPGPRIAPLACWKHADRRAAGLEVHRLADGAPPAPCRHHPPAHRRLCARPCCSEDRGRSRSRSRSGRSSSRSRCGAAPERRRRQWGRRRPARLRLLRACKSIAC